MSRAPASERQPDRQKVTQDELGRRLRAAREAVGLTQEEAAEVLGVSRSTVAQMELGNRGVSGLELDRLARLYGRDIRSFLRVDAQQTDPLAVLFRAESGLVRDEALRMELGRKLELGRSIHSLEGLLGRRRREPRVEGYELPPPSETWQAVEQGERAASEERQRLGQGGEPLGDLAELLESVGVRTAWVALPEEISGLTFQAPDVGPFVVVNSRHHWNRRRFSYAHEYAHVLLDRDRVGTVSRTSERGDLREVRANAFAAAFLMPEQGLREMVEELGKGGRSRPRFQLFDEEAVLAVEGRREPGSQELQLYDVVRLAHQFGVSRTSMLYRLRNLRLVTQAHLEDLLVLEQTGRGRDLERLFGLPDLDHAAARGQFRSRFLSLALEAFRREEITRAKLAELARLVDLSDDELDRLVVDAGLEDDIVDEVLIPGTDE